jgi:hypothetical protein
LYATYYTAVSDSSVPGIGKGTKVKLSHYRPGQTLRVPGGSGSQFSRQSTHECGKVVSPINRSPLPPQEIFLVLISVKRLSRPQDHSAAGRIMSMKNSNDTIGNRNRSASTNCATATRSSCTPLCWTPWGWHLVVETYLHYTGHTQKNGAVSKEFTIDTAPFFCVCPVYAFYLVHLFVVMKITETQVVTSLTNEALLWLWKRSIPAQTAALPFILFDVVKSQTNFYRDRENRKPVMPVVTHAWLTNLAQ